MRNDHLFGQSQGVQVLWQTVHALRLVGHQFSEQLVSLYRFLLDVFVNLTAPYQGLEQCGFFSLSARM
jgi:hypothetical protein